MKRQTGFTLLEVLVATAVLAIAMLALVRSGQSSALVVEHVRDQTVAAWVAANAVAQVELEDAFPALGPRAGVDTMGTRTWSWRGEIMGTPDPDLRRFEVSVYTEEGADDVEYTLVAFLGRY